MKVINLIKLTSILACVSTAGCRHTTEESAQILLRSRSGSAVLSLDGARILSWKDAGGNELFFMPANPFSSNGDWSHGGTLLCWPWFGRKGAVQSDIHGFARNRRFELIDLNSDSKGETATLELNVSAKDHPAFPYDAKLTLTVTLADKLRLKLKTENTGTRSFQISEGFQSYFPVSSYSNVTFTKVDKTDFTTVNGMDKAFRRLEDNFGFKDILPNRKINLKASGNSGVVLWSPGTIEPANRNLAPDDCPRFIVIGPSNRTQEGAIVLKPGQTHELSYELSVN